MNPHAAATIVGLIVGSVSWLFWQAAGHGFSSEGTPADAARSLLLVAAICVAVANAAAFFVRSRIRRAEEEMYRERQLRRNT